MNEAMKFLHSFSGGLPALIFLGGIHGVGKTTVCDKVFKPAGYHCVTASSLISGCCQKAGQDKQVDCVSENQVTLLKQLSLEKEINPRLLLDGHFSLVNSKNQIELIDIEVFRAINPSLLILIKGKPEKIIERLNKRDGKQWDMSFVTQFQIIEETHANHVSKELHIPLQVFLNKDGRFK